MQKINLKEYPLFPSQKKILRKIQPAHHWNISYMLFLEKKYDADILKQVLQDIVDRYEVFKLRFINKNNSYIQVYHPDEKNHFSFHQIEILPGDNDDKIYNFMMLVQESININNGPLLSAGLVKTNNGDHFYIVVHHLISDAYSFKLLINDIISGYKSIKIYNKKYNPKVHGSFIKAVEELYEYSRSNEINKDIQYWKKVLQTKTKQLPADNKITEEQRIELNTSDIFETVLAAEQYEKLKSILKTYKIYEFNIFLSVLGLSLCDWINDKNVFVKLTHHGRNRFKGNVHLHRTPGPLWTVYPVILDTKNRDNTIERINKIKEMLSKITDNGRSFEILQEITLENNREFINKIDNIPNILFNYYGKMNENFVIDPDFGYVSPYFKDLNRDKTSYCNFVLIFNLREIDNCLKLQLIYNNLEFVSLNIKKLFNLFRDNLKFSLEELIKKKLINK